MPDRTDRELLEQLRLMLAARRVSLVLDARRLDLTDSPVSVQAESTRWLYAFVLGVAAAVWWSGAAGGAGAGTLAVALWYGWVRPDIARRIRGRVEGRALFEVELWRRAWRHGGIAIAERGQPICRAPDGNWMEFVRARCPRCRSGEGT
jgi:hypothetical protein